MARPEKKRKFKRRIAVLGDGITEKIYFEQLKELEQIKDVVIKPEPPSKSSRGGAYKKPINTAKALVEEGYDHVYCLIDFDTVLSENKLEEFTQELKSINSNEITIYINNPCFEIWVLVHYEKTGRAFTGCDAAGNAISKHLNDYCKNQRYLWKKNLYKILRPHLETNGIPNAKFLERDREGRDNNYPRAEVYKFLENIL